MDGTSGSPHRPLMRRKSKDEYEVQNWLLLPKIWVRHYSGSLVACEAIYAALVRSGGTARLVRNADGYVLKEFHPC